ncbi:MAG: hypothetical protein IKC93_04160 [Candidatus Methanomethylophilaceae archaeon]|nr:hypothetical protein [Candidatus Methanomethylophilaceae archaeon]
MPVFVEPRVSNPVRQKFESYLRSAMAYCSARGLELRFEAVGLTDRGIVTTEGGPRDGFRFGYSLVPTGTEVPDPWGVGDLVYAALGDSVWNTADRDVEERDDCFVLRLRDRNDPKKVHVCEVSVAMRDEEGSFVIRRRDQTNGACGFHVVEGIAGFDGMVAALHPEEKPSKAVRRACLKAMTEDPGKCTAVVYAEVVRDLYANMGVDA